MVQLAAFVTLVANKINKSNSSNNLLHMMVFLILFGANVTKAARCTIKSKKNQLLVEQTQQLVDLVYTK